MFYFSLVKTFKEITEKLPHFCKIIDIQSVSFKLYEIISVFRLILAKVTPKKSSGR